MFGIDAVRLMTEASALRDRRSRQSEISPGSVVVASTGAPFEQVLLDGRHVLTADEPAAAGGGDAGPGLHELLLMALGSCTSMTIKMYAAHSGWPFEGVEVRLHHGRVHAADCADCETKDVKLDRIDRTLRFIGPLSAEQRKRLLEIANK